MHHDCKFEVRGGSLWGRLAVRQPAAPVGAPFGPGPAAIANRRAGCYPAPQPAYSPPYQSTFGPTMATASAAAPRNVPKGSSIEAG